MNRLAVEVTDLCQHNVALETVRPRPVVAILEEPTASKQRSDSQLHALKPLDKNSLFPDVTQSAFVVYYIVHNSVPRPPQGYDNRAGRRVLL